VQGKRVLAAGHSIRFGTFSVIPTPTQGRESNPEKVATLSKSSNYCSDIRQACSNAQSTEDQNSPNRGCIFVKQRGYDVHQKPPPQLSIILTRLCIRLNKISSESAANQQRQLQHTESELILPRILQLQQIERVPILPRILSV